MRTQLAPLDQVVEGFAENLFALSSMRFDSRLLLAH